MDELRKTFHQEVDAIRDQVIRLGASVIEAIPRATAVLLSGDLEGADYLVQSDDEIDARAVDIEDHCFQQLALQAPVAGDLRQLVSIIKITGELERSADLAVNICKGARRIYGHDIDPVLRGLITKMAEQAQQLFISAMDAFELNDAPRLQPLMTWTHFWMGCIVSSFKKFLNVMLEAKWMFRLPCNSQSSADSSNA